MAEEELQSDEEDRASQPAPPSSTLVLRVSMIRAIPRIVPETVFVAPATTRIHLPLPQAKMRTAAGLVHVSDDKTQLLGAKKVLLF